VKDDGGVSKKIADAKKALDTAKNDPKVGTKSGHSGIGDPPKPPVPVAPAVSKTPDPGYTGLLHMQIGDSVHGVQERDKQAEGVKDVLAPKTMHDGGEVEEDGPKILQKGEIVLPKDKDKAEKMAMDKLSKKAKGVMSSAMDEVDEEKDEPKAEEKHETKKEEKSEDHKSEKKSGEKDGKKEDKKESKSDGKKPAGKKHVGFHGYSHKGGHVVHHMYDDGSSETHNFALGDHAGVGSNIADVLGQQAPEGEGGGAGEGAGLQPQGGGGAEGGGQGGASPEPAEKL
jgi:hypothetical protein